MIHTSHKQIAIIGVGVMGGSLALALKKHVGGLTLIGYDTPEVMAWAEQHGVIDQVASTPEEAVREADLVVLATPLRALLHLIERIAPALRPGTVVTDMGSVKRPVQDQAKQVLPPEVTFVGGHPMTGSEHSGVAHADAFLFENATYVLCPPTHINEEELVAHVPGLIQLLQATGARLMVLGADRHDRIAAAVSHLPQLLAVLLMNEAAVLHEKDDAFLRLAAGGFRDMTRIASSSFGMWQDILIANDGEVLEALARFESAVRTLRNRLIKEDYSAVQDAFERAGTARDTIPKNTKGFLYPLVDIYVYTEDKPGALLAIISSLHGADLDVKDIELLKLREGTGGTFRVGFADAPTADRAVKVLHEQGCPAYRL